MSESIIKIGITIGDPAGIGPEVTVKAVRELSGSNYLPVVIARADILKKYYPDYFQDYKIIPEKKIETLKEIKNKKILFDIGLEYPIPSPGKGSIYTGFESRLYIDKAVELWKIGLLDGIVTGPVSKAYIEKSGCRFTGHTEYIAQLINEDNPYMMMYSDNYRVILASTHIPVKDIAKTINADKLYDTIKTGYKAISSIDGTKNISIAIAGLDPHCGDEGAIGNFDIEITGKVVEKAAKDGINIQGPYAADTLFTPQKWKKYNLAVAHYHDQGLIPFKVLAFETGVNITLGLSITRTSPDHGTAYDIAGKNMANHKSMKAAIELACRLCMQKLNKK